MEAQSEQVISVEDMERFCAEAQDEAIAAAQEVAREKFIATLVRLIERQRPQLTGTCPHGKTVYVDDIGAYSSGLYGHKTESGTYESGQAGICDARSEDIQWDEEPQRKRKELRELINQIKQSAAD